MAVSVPPHVQRQQDRAPAVDYRLALTSLCRALLVDEISDDAYAFGVKMVADIYWLSDARVRRDVVRMLREWQA